MRRFPSSWDKTLTALGLRRVKPKQKSTTRNRVGAELLERREMLSGTPIEPAYSFVASENPGAYDPASQFTLATEYADVTGEPRAVLKLRDDLTEETLQVSLQEIGLELRQGDHVIETQSILIDIAEPEFLEQFQADRADEAGQQGVIASTGATIAGVPLETLLDSGTFIDGRQSGEIGVTTAIAYYDAFAVAVFNAATLATSGEATAEEQIAASEEAYQLSAAGLRLVGRIAIDRVSDNAALSVAAQSLRDALAEHSAEYHTAFAGLGRTDEVVREWRQGGSEEFVLALVDESAYQASDRFRIDLGDQAAMVQVSIVSGSGLVTAALQATFVDTATKDVTVASDQPTTNLDGQALVAKQVVGGDSSEAIFTIPLTNHSGAVPDSALVEIQADSIVAAGTARVSAHWDFWGKTQPAIVGPDFDEGTLTWDTYQASLASGFRGSLDDQFISAPGDYSFDVTEAVQRALTAGDANVDGQFNAVPTGFVGDIEAMYQAVSDWDAYVATFGAAAGASGTVNGTVEALRHRTDLDWDGDTDASDFMLAADRLGFLKGDFNIDGVIDGYDYSLWQENYGRAAKLLQHGDPNADAITDAADYTVWRDGEGNSHGSPLPTAITFRVTADPGTEIAFDSTETAGSWGGVTPKPAQLTSLAASDVVLTHFTQATTGFGWDLGYRVLNEAWIDGLELEVLADGQSVYTATGPSAAVGANTISVDPTQINLTGAVGALTLVLRNSNGDELSRRDFAGGLFADALGAWRYYGTEQDDEITIDDSSIAIGSDYSVTAAGVQRSGFNGAFTQTVYFDTPTNTPYGGSAPTAIYVHAGGGLDLIRNELNLSPVFWADGGSGDDTYDLTTSGNTMAHNAQVTIVDPSGIDGLLLSAYARDDDTLDLGSTAPQVLDDDATGHDLTITFGSDQAIQHVGTAAFPGVSGLGYSSSLFVVDTLDHEDDGLVGADQLSLREAVKLSELIAGAHSIEFDPSVYSGQPITLPVGDEPLTAAQGDAFNITQSLTITGPGQGVLTLDGEGKSRAFIVRAGAELTLTDVTIENGASFGGGEGGGLHAKGDLTLERTTWRNNITWGSSSWSGGSGGAIYARDANVTIRDSTFEGNDARYAGAIYFRPDDGQKLLIERSTFNNNQAVKRYNHGGFGGAIVHTAWSTVPGSLMRIENSTISGNHAQYGGIIWVNGSGSDTRLMTEIVNSTIVQNTVDGTINGGAGLYNASNGATTLYNTILADNVNDADGAGGEHDLFIHNTDRLSGSNNLVGLAAQSDNQINGALTNGIRISDSEDAGLLPLANYGGPVKTHALEADSLAVNNGSLDNALELSGNPITFDQRGEGFIRVFDNAIDIGAHESLVVSEGAGASQVLSISGTEFDDSFASIDNVLFINWGDGTNYQITIDPMATVTIDGGEGDDTIDASGFVASEVSLHGGDGDDTIIGTPGQDVIRGGWGNDRLEGGLGDDDLYGNRGNDTYIFSGSQALGTDKVIEFVIGEPLGEDSGWDIHRLGGQDTLDFSGAAFGIGLDVDLSDGYLGQNPVRDVLTEGQNTYLTLDLSGGLGLWIEDVIGTQYNDTIRGNANSNRLNGNGGVDLLDGGNSAIFNGEAIGREDTFVVSDELAVDSHYTIAGSSRSGFIDLSRWHGGIERLDISDAASQTISPTSAANQVQLQIAPGAVNAVVGFFDSQDGIETVPSELLVDDSSDVIDTNYGPGSLSLREALIIARADEGHNRIEIGIPISIASGTLEVDSDVSLVGATAFSQGLLNNYSGLRTINAYSGLQVDVSGLAFRGGSATQTYFNVLSGGAIQSEANLTVSNSRFSNNAASASGGALYQRQGDLRIADTIFDNNRVERSEFGFGGAIDAAGGNLVIERSTFKDNVATNSGGALHYLDGDLTIRQTLFESNVAQGISSATGSGRGGAINVSGDNLLIEKTAFAGNSVEGDGVGGAVAAGVFRSIAIDSSSVYGNEADAGGGLHVSPAAELRVTNSTISSNVARTRGGGILLNYSDARALPTATFTNITVAYNSEPPRSSQFSRRGAGIEIGDGYARPEDGLLLELNNTILAENRWTNGDAADFDPAILLAQTSRNNLFGYDGSGGLLHDPGGSGNLLLGQFEAAGLVPFDSDAYGTIVYALDEFSPAVDAGDNTLAMQSGVRYGQNGEPRFVSDTAGDLGTVNIGASGIVTHLGAPTGTVFEPELALNGYEVIPVVAGEQLLIGRLSPVVGADANWTASASIGGYQDVTITPEGLVYWEPIIEIGASPLPVEFAITDNDGLANYRLTLNVAGVNPDASLDSDGDGLSDFDEIIVFNTSPRSADTDADSLSDYVEVLGQGLDPLIPIGPDDLDQDHDGDGILTSDEIIFGSNPGLQDTDSDGVLDGVEILSGSNPADPNDLGQPYSVRHIRFTMGDPSGSASELWEMIVRDDNENIVFRVNPPVGKVVERVYSIIDGERHTLEVVWRSGGRDYDYNATLSASTGGRSIDSQTGRVISYDGVLPFGIPIDDPHGILGVHNNVAQSHFVDKRVSFGTSFDGLRLDGVNQLAQDTIPGVLPLNDNDSNDSGVDDRLEPLAWNEVDRDWRLLDIQTGTANASETYLIKATNNLRLWEFDGLRWALINNTHELLPEQGHQLYVEGHTEGVGEIRLGTTTDGSTISEQTDLVLVNVDKLILQAAKIRDLANSDTFNDTDGSLPMLEGVQRDKGAFLPVNDDDDNDNGLDDFSEFKLSAFDAGDLLPFGIQRLARDLDGTYSDVSYKLLLEKTIVGNSAARSEYRVFEKLGDGTFKKIPFNTEIDFGGAPQKLLYLEATGSARAQRVLKLVAEMNFAAGQVQKLTRDLYVTPLRLAGAQNVASTSRHHYEVQNANGSFEAPRYGTADSTNGASQAVHWDQEQQYPAVGKVRYRASDSYTWGFHVNVITVEINFSPDATKAEKGNTQPLEYLPTLEGRNNGDTTEYVASAPFINDAMRTQVTVTAMRGPTVSTTGGSISIQHRGVRNFELGFIQTITPTEWQANFASNTTRTHNQEGVTRLDKVTVDENGKPKVSETPWYDTVGQTWEGGLKGGRPAYFDTSTQRDVPAAGFSGVFTMGDRPISPVAESTLIGNLNPVRLESVQHRLEFDTYFTIASKNDDQTKTVYTQLAKFSWFFVADGHYDTSGRWASDGAEVQTRNYVEVTTGDVVPISSLPEKVYNDEIRTYGGVNESKNWR